MPDFAVFCADPTRKPPKLGTLSHFLQTLMHSTRCRETSALLRFSGAPLRKLRLHPIRRVEVLSGISDELRVAWMIDSFHSDDDVHQLGIVVVNVFDQFGLCIGWPCNENRTGVFN